MRKAYRPIVVYGDPILVRRAEPVTLIKHKLIILVEDMKETMYQNRGVGLAAPQVGESVRVIVLDTSSGKDPGQQIVLLNPEIVGAEKEEVADEGCLSIPEFITPVVRATVLEVEGQTLEGKTLQIRAEGLAARVLQHEIDHINGRLIVDTLNPLQRDLFERRWRESRLQGRNSS